MGTSPWRFGAMVCLPVFRTRAKVCHGRNSMATTIWKGHIAFGLVSFPVRLQAAARSQSVSYAALAQWTVHNREHLGPGLKIGCRSSGGPAETFRWDKTDWSP